MNLPKAYFIDIDGTLLYGHRQKTLSKDDLYAIKNASKNGVYIILTTGRSIEDVDYVWKQFADNTKFTGYVIANNGSIIVNKNNNKILFEDNIDEKEFYEIAKFAEENKYAIKNSSGKKFYSKNKIISLGIKLVKKDGVDSNFDNFIYNKNSSKKLGIVASWSKQKIQRICKKLINKYDKKLEIVVSGPGLFIEINKKGVSKGAAEKFLSKELDFSLKDAVHIGDSMNDLSGFKACGRSVAMKNGMKQLKKESTFITKSVKKSGVANAIRSLSIEKK